MAVVLHWHLIDGRRLLAFALAAVLLLVGTGSALAQDEREPVRIDGRTVLRCAPDRNVVSPPAGRSAS